MRSYLFFPCSIDRNQTISWGFHPALTAVQNQKFLNCAPSFFKNDINAANWIIIYVFSICAQFKYVQKYKIV